MTALNRSAVAATPTPMLTVGVGTSTAQHGELFQGQIEDGSGRARRCLVSLPCPARTSSARFTPEPDVPLRVAPVHKVKALKTSRLLLESVDAGSIGGLLEIESNIPEAKGLGSSTADCVAAARAVAAAIDERPTPAELAQLVVAGETASDTLMFDRAVLFAHREGLVLEDFATPVPPLDVIGIDTDPNGFVDTLDMTPAAYSGDDVEMFHALIGGLRHAMRRQDAWLMGRIASTCARINQRFLPKPMFDECQRLADEIGVLGIAVAHSGTVLSFLLDPRDPALPRRVDLLLRGLDGLGVREVLRFRTHKGIRRTCTR